MIYAAHNEEGKIIGFYDSNIHKKLPENKIPITNQEHQFILANPNNFRVNVNSQTLEQIKIDSEKLQLTIKLLNITEESAKLRQKMFSMDWYYIRKFRIGVKVPEAIEKQMEDAHKRLQELQLEEEITREKINGSD